MFLLWLELEVWLVELVIMWRFYLWLSGVTKNETWGNMYELDNMQDTLNSFLNTFLITFESCFPAQHTTTK